MVSLESQQPVMSPSDLESLGMHHIAYVKSVVLDGQTAYGVFAANGTAIATPFLDRAVAFAAVRQHDLEPVHVH